MPADRARSDNSNAPPSEALSVIPGAAVDVDRLAGDEAAIVTDEEQAGGGDFVDMPLAAQRDAGGAGHSPLIPFRVVPPGVDAARGHHIDPDVLPGEFRGQRPRQPDQAHL